jgi:hypothetical protein
VADDVYFRVTRRDPNLDEPRAQCLVCGEWMPLDEIMVHVRVEHDLDVEFAEWPDGSPVVIDETLQPEDFEP